MAKYLLDSNAFLTFKGDPFALRKEAHEAIKSPANEILVSIACLWELAIKAANGKLPAYAAMIADGPDGLMKSLTESGLSLLHIDVSHVLAAAALPQHHRDPFDRVMIAQALTENLTLITRDRIFLAYTGLRVLQA